jgi:hypothetical protein
LSGGKLKKFGGSLKYLCMKNLHSFPLNKPKKLKKYPACGGRTMREGIYLVILITFFFYLTFQCVKV